MEGRETLIEEKEHLRLITKELSEQVNDEEVLNSMTREELIDALKLATEFLVEGNSLLIEIFDVYLEMTE